MHPFSLHASLVSSSASSSKLWKALRGEEERRRRWGIGAQPGRYLPRGNPVSSAPGKPALLCQVSPTDPQHSCLSEGGTHSRGSSSMLSLTCDTASSSFSTESVWEPCRVGGSAMSGSLRKTQGLSCPVQHQPGSANPVTGVRGSCQWGPSVPRKQPEAPPWAGSFFALTCK